MGAQNSPVQAAAGVDAAAIGQDKDFERWQRTAIAAFFRAEARGFVPGHELEDWLAAERELATAGGSGVTSVGAAAVPETRSPGRRTRTTTPSGQAPTRSERPVAKATASKKAAAVKKASRTRKTKPGTGTDLGGAA